MSKIPFEFPAWLGSLNKSDHEFQLNDKFGGGVIAFRNLDDPSKYLSSEFAAEFVDELTKNKREMFDFLNMRLRWPGIPDTRFIAASNPGEIGHGWVKKLWISRDFTDENFDPSEFHFVRSKYSDNKYIDPSYEKQLDTLPEQLRRAYKDGDWDIFAGQYFSEFRREYHVCEPFEIPDSWPRLIGLDYGYSAQSAVVWLAYDQAFKTFYVYRELYMKGLTYSQLAERIRDTEDSQARLIIADPAIFAKKDSPNSGAMEMQNVLKGFKIYPGNNNRIIGWGEIREYLKTYDYEGKKKGRLRIFTTCPELIRILPELVYDEHKTEDLSSDGEDHLADAGRYAIMYFKEKHKQTVPQSYTLGPGTSYISSKSDFDIEFGEKEEPIFTF